jgi:hypothetical protein
MSVYYIIYYRVSIKYVYIYYIEKYCMMWWKNKKKNPLASHNYFIKIVIVKWTK